MPNIAPPPYENGRTKPILLSWGPFPSTRTVVAWFRTLRPCKGQLILVLAIYFPTKILVAREFRLASNVPCMPPSAFIPDPRLLCRRIFSTFEIAERYPPFRIFHCLLARTPAVFRFVRLPLACPASSIVPTNRAFAALGDRWQSLRTCDASLGGNLGQPSASALPRSNGFFAARRVLPSSLIRASAKLSGLIMEFALVFSVNEALCLK